MYVKNWEQDLKPSSLATFNRNIFSFESINFTLIYNYFRIEIFQKENKKVLFGSCKATTRKQHCFSMNLWITAAMLDLRNSGNEMFFIQVLLVIFNFLNDPSSHTETAQRWKSQRLLNVFVAIIVIATIRRDRSDHLDYMETSLIETKLCLRGSLLWILIFC